MKEKMMSRNISAIIAITIIVCWVVFKMPETAENIASAAIGGLVGFLSRQPK